jgi:isopentenyl-diphosphate delta-isomerase type 1
MSPELLQTYSESGVPGTLAPRPVVHRQGLWHRAVNVFLFRSDGRLLVQRRSEAKDVCPGAWDLSVAEHLLPGEAYIDAARRGLAEELSIHKAEIRSLGGETHATLEDPERQIFDREFQQCYAATSDEAVVIDATEVSEVAFHELADLEKMMAANPALFTPWFLRMAEYVRLFEVDRAAHLNRETSFFN